MKAFLFFLFSFSPAVMGVSIFDNMTAGFSNELGSGHNVMTQGRYYEFGYWQDMDVAVSFIPTGSGKLTSLDVPLRTFLPGAGAEGTLSLKIYNNSSERPGNILYGSALITGIEAENVQLYSAPVNSLRSLTAGEKYWVVADSGAHDKILWMAAEPETMQTYLQSVNWGSWREGFQQASGLRANVPEVSTCILFGSGLGGIWITRRRRHGHKTR